MSALLHLRQHPIFGRASESVLTRFSERATLRHWTKGSFLVRAGDPFAHVYVFLSGGVELSRKNRDEGTQILLGQLTAPAVFGDAQLFGGAKVWQSSARVTRAMKGLVFLAADFDAFSRADRELAAALYREACIKHLLTIELIQVFALQKIQHKILRLLWSASAPPDGTNSRRLAHVSQVTLARALGVNARTVARAFKQLEDQNLIKRTSGAVELHVSDHAAFAGQLGTSGTSGASWSLLPDEG